MHIWHATLSPSIKVLKNGWNGGLELEINKRACHGCRGQPQPHASYVNISSSGWRTEDTQGHKTIGKFSAIRVDFIWCNLFFLKKTLQKMQPGSKNGMANLKIAIILSKNNFGLDPNFKHRF
jgi:hypothetical protein